ncbi:UPF0149 family protein [Methylomarinum vadi]|uniref:UPF0149 family protein n=1 Tax=Methylomarinum vadi TaxID=438855 RepID=UPI0004DF0C76|nr:UPF0149 family protein [Methylomarinum vadi]
MTYQTINAIFTGHAADLDVAEAHGMASGLLCVDIRAKADDWLRELFPEDVSLTEEENSLLLALFEQTRELLNAQDEQFAFDLLLPDDDAELSEQVEALRHWCQGFLFGVGYAKSTSVWPGDCGEIMRDIVEFTKVDAEADGEEDENAFMEIHEYLRSAVLLIRDQLMENAEQQSRQ